MYVNNHAPAECNVNHTNAILVKPLSLTSSGSMIGEFGPEKDTNEHVSWVAQCGCFVYVE